jgi:hypothetical protein
MTSKYSSLYKDIYSVFALAGWTATGIKTFPENYVTTGVGNEYIRVNILAGSDNSAKAHNAVAGVVIIDIFVPAGGGSLRVTAIADELDAYLAGNSLSTTSYGNTQFLSSTLINLGNDTANPSLFRSKYSIPFNYFGV